jgi:hypothetical protein
MSVKDLAHSRKEFADSPSIIRRKLLGSLHQLLSRFPLYPQARVGTGDPPVRGAQLRWLKVCRQHNRGRAALQHLP